MFTGILALLHEIYTQDNLKTGLKFEVELLFKTLHVSIDSVTPSALLSGVQRDVLNNPDFQVDKAAVGPPPVTKPETGPLLPPPEGVKPQVGWVGATREQVHQGC